jgi:hypothetical protein
MIHDVLAIGSYGFNLTPRPREDDKLHTEWLCRPFTVFRKPYIAG